MSMEDILKVLVNSRQQGSSVGQPSSDPMTDLIGGLLGQQQAPSASPQQSGLGDMMGLLEMFMGGGQSGSMGMTNQSMTMNSPIMALLQPFVVQLAKKMKIPPEIAMIVVSFVAHKLLAHHPTSGRDSNTFDLDDLLGQMNSGKINPNTLYDSGMVNEISRMTGMNEAQAAKTLITTLSMFGKQIQPGKKPASAVRNRVSSSSRSMRSATVRTGKVKRQ